MSLSYCVLWMQALVTHLSSLALSCGIECHYRARSFPNCTRKTKQITYTKEDMQYVIFWFSFWGCFYQQDKRKLKKTDILLFRCCKTKWTILLMCSVHYNLHFQVHQKTNIITSFCGHLTYTETLWKVVKWSMKWPMEMFCSRHTFLFVTIYGLIWDL